MTGREGERAVLMRDRDSGFWIPAEHGDGDAEDVYHNRGREVRASNGTNHIRILRHSHPANC